MWVWTRSLQRYKSQELQSKVVSNVLNAINAMDLKHQSNVIFVWSLRVQALKRSTFRRFFMGRDAISFRLKHWQWTLQY